MEVLNGAAEAASARGYELILLPQDADLERKHPFAIDGAIVIDPADDDPLIRVLTQREKPIVTIGRHGAPSDDLPFVDYDHRAIARQMLDYLAAQGYESPALISTTPTRSYIVDIIDEYNAWTSAHGIPARIVTLSEPPEEHTAALAARRLLGGPDAPDAIYATYDRLALGVLHEAHRLGVDVPAQLGLTCAVDGDLLRWAHPAVTGTFLDPPRAGEEAVSLLVDLLDGEQRETTKVILPAHIVARDSTARLTTAQAHEALGDQAPQLG
jgi:DNA-binding LacI/PurR family transcriptional regulator